MRTPRHFKKQNIRTENQAPFSIRDTEIIETRKSTKIVEFAGECSLFQQPSLKNLRFSVFLAIGAVESSKSTKIIEFAGECFSSSHP